jgi:SAM-dependent methyltransferase
MNSLEVLRIGASYQRAQILLSAVKLGIFEELEHGPLSADALAGLTNSDRHFLECLLDALTAMGVLAKRHGAYRVPAALRKPLSPLSEDSILPMLRQNVRMWDRWARLSTVVRDGIFRNMRRRRTAQDIKTFIGAMHSIGRPLAETVARACRIANRSRRLLDIGGASGTYTMAFLTAYPHLTATIFDLPAVIPLAKERIRASAVSNRVQFQAGDFYRDDLPKEHDLALLSAIIHQHGRVENRRLYRKVLQALAPGGALIIRDYVMNLDRTRPVDGALFAVNILVTTGAGGTQPLDEISADLKASGFTRVRLIRRGRWMDSIVVAT